MAARLRESVHPYLWDFLYRFPFGSWRAFRVPRCECVACCVGAGDGAARMVLLRCSCRCCRPCLPLFWRWPCGGLARVGFLSGWSSWLSGFLFISQDTLGCLRNAPSDSAGESATRQSERYWIVSQTFSEKIMPSVTLWLAVAPLRP